MLLQTLSCESGLIIGGKYVVLLPYLSGARGYQISAALLTFVGAVILLQTSVKLRSNRLIRCSVSSHTLHFVSFVKQALTPALFPSPLLLDLLVR